MSKSSENAFLIFAVFVSTSLVTPAIAQAPSSGAVDTLMQLLPFALIGAVIWFFAKKGRTAGNGSTPSTPDERLRKKAEAYAEKYYTFFIPKFSGYISAGRPDFVPKVFMDSIRQGKNYSEAAKEYIIHEYMRTGKKPDW